MIPLLTLFVSNLRRHHVAALLGAAAVSVLIGGGLFAVTEHVSVGTGLYWALVTASTVGYGDVTPHTTGGRIVALLVILTAIPMFASVFALIAGLAALTQIRRLLGMDHVTPSGRFTVVYGMQPVVPQILEDLIATGRTVVLVADVAAGDVHERARLLAGDPTNEVVLRRSHPERAESALVACADDGDVLVTCVALRSLAPSLDVIALARAPKIAQALRDLGVGRTLASDELVAHTLAKTLEAPHAGDLLLRLIDSAHYRMQEQAVDADMVGKSLDQVELHPPALVLGVLRDGVVSPILSDDPRLRANDVLITLATRAA